MLRFCVCLLFCGLLLASDISDYRQAKEAYIRADYDTAWELFSRIPSDSPLFAYAVHYASNVALKQKQFEAGLKLNLFPQREAELPYLEKRNSNHLLLQFYGGETLSDAQLLTCAKILISQWQYGDALRCLQKLAPFRHSDPSIQILLARCYGGSGQKDRAQELWAALPDSAEKLYYLAALSPTEDVKATYYRQMIRDFPDQTLTYDGAFTLFRSHKKKNELSEALEILNYLETTPPHRLRALFEKGLLYFEKGEFPSAMAYFRKCSSGDFTDASLYWQAKTQERLGEMQTSRQTLLNLQTQFPLSYYSYRAYCVTQVLPVYRFNEEPLPSSPVDSSVFPERLKALLEAHAYDDAFHELKTFYAQRTDYRHYLTNDLLQKGEYFYAIRLSEPTTNVNITYPRPYFNHIESALSTNTLDPYLVMALMREESNFNPLAVSSSGARGLMQLMPFVAKDMAKRMNIEAYDLFVPADNMVFGLAHLKYDVQSLGLLKGVAAYNAGIGAVGRMRKVDDIDLFAENIPIAETHYYVKKVWRSYWIYKLIYDNRNIAQF